MRTFLQQFLDHLSFHILLHSLPLISLPGRTLTKSQPSPDPIIYRTGLKPLQRLEKLWSPIIMSAPTLWNDKTPTYVHAKIITSPKFCDYRSFSELDFSSVPLLCCVQIHILVSRCGGLLALVAYFHKGCWKICFNIEYRNTYFHNSRRWEGPFIFNSCYISLSLWFWRRFWLSLFLPTGYKDLPRLRTFLPATHSVLNSWDKNFLTIELVLFLPPHVVCVLCFCFLKGRVARFNKYKHMQRLGPTYMRKFFVVYLKSEFNWAYFIQLSSLEREEKETLVFNENWVHCFYSFHWLLTKNPAT